MYCSSSFLNNFVLMHILAWITGMTTNDHTESFRVAQFQLQSNLRYAWLISLLSFLSLQYRMSKNNITCIHFTKSLRNLFTTTILSQLKEVLKQPESYQKVVDYTICIIIVFLSYHVIYHCNIIVISACNSST